MCIMLVFMSVTIKSLVTNFSNIDFNACLYSKRAVCNPLLFHTFSELYKVKYAQYNMHVVLTSFM